MAFDNVEWDVDHALEFDAAVAHHLVVLAVIPRYVHIGRFAVQLLRGDEYLDDYPCRGRIEVVEVKLDVGVLVWLAVIFCEPRLHRAEKLDHVLGQRLALKPENAFLLVQFYSRRVARSLYYDGFQHII